MSRASHYRRRGFTIVEVMLALAIAVLLGAAILSMMLNLSKRRTAMIELAGQQQATGVFLDRLEADVSTALAGDAAVGAGVKGTGTELALLSRGVVLGESLSGASGRALGDLQGCRYLFDSKSGALKARRWTAGRGTAEGGEFEIVSARIRRVRFRYFDGREWRGSYDSLAQGGLPVAIECAVWAGGVVGSASPSVEPGKERWGAPDRIRVIAVLDGPLAAWKENR